MRVRTPRLIPGAALLGFFGICEGDFGDPNTKRPYAVVTPSRVGAAILPFPCPRCSRPFQEVACPRVRDHFKDPRPGKDYHFCPGCGERFRVDFDGAAPLADALPAGAAVAPATIKRGKKTEVVDLSKRRAGDGLVVLGCA